jgi:hypothetical protein
MLSNPRILFDGSLLMDSPPRPIHESEEKFWPVGWESRGLVCIALSSRRFSSICGVNFRSWLCWIGSDFFNFSSLRTEGLYIRGFRRHA